MSRTATPTELHSPTGAIPRNGGSVAVPALGMASRTMTPSLYEKPGVIDHVDVAPITPPEGMGRPKSGAVKRPAGRPASPQFDMKREPVEQLLEKPRFSAGWYRKAERGRQEDADAPTPMPHTEAALAAAAAGTPVRGGGGGGGLGETDEAGQLTPKDAKETWSVVYQEVPDMIIELKTRARGVDAADRAGWTALHWAALLGKDGHARALLDAGASCKAETAASVGREVRASGKAASFRCLSAVFHCLSAAVFH